MEHAAELKTDDRDLLRISLGRANVPLLDNCATGQVRLASPRREGVRTWSAIQSSIRFAS